MPARVSPPSDAKRESRGIDWGKVFAQDVTVLRYGTDYTCPQPSLYKAITEAAKLHGWKIRVVMRGDNMVIVPIERAGG